MDLSNLPEINATLNSISAILLVIGFILIKQGKKKQHRYVMTGALVSSALFLLCYLYYHYKVGHVEFPKEYPTARKIYLAILLPHILLATINLPLISLLVIAAVRGNFERHKWFARFTYPSWLFVSVTGVIIYVMVYHWFVPSSDHSAVKAAVITEKAVAGKVEFSPAVQSIHVEAGVETVTASVRVFNTGQKPVLINKLESGCSCLSVSMPSRRIEPGGKVDITGVFNTEKLSGEAEKRITVGTDQEGERDTFLTVKLKIDPLYLIEEKMTSWKIGEEATPKVIRFDVSREVPIRILKIKSSRDEMSCEIKTIEDGRKYELVLTPATTSSHLLGFIRIETDCELEHHARPLAYFSIQ